MSTDLYGIRILEIAPEERRIRMRVFSVYYDTHHGYHQEVPQDRSFFVRVLCGKEALGDDISWDDRFDEGFINRNAFRYVERFDELERRNDPIESYEGMSDFYYERDGGWVDEEKLVQADFDLFVTKEEYVAPFSVGDTWGTTSYETQSDDLTEADYAEIPDFGDVKKIDPFPENDAESSTVRRLSFSADGTQLLVCHDDGGFVVFSTSDWSKTAELPKGFPWFSDFGWTVDGRVAVWDEKQFIAIDLETMEQQPYETPFGWAPSSSGRRFVNTFLSDQMLLFNEQGETLLELERPMETMVYAGYDATDDYCALVIETQHLRMIDLKNKEVRDLPKWTGVRSVALSPDGRFVLVGNSVGFAVLRATTGEAIRFQPRGAGYTTAVAWSPDGRIAITSLTDQNGYHSKLSVHRIGKEIIAAESAPLRAPKVETRDIVDLANLFVAQTDSFSPGWASHLNDDFLDFHLALKRHGKTYDLVPRMNTPETKIAARAYEAIILNRREEHDAARAALDEALLLLGSYEVPEWSHTYIYAPLAAAQFVLGDDPEPSLKLAKVAFEDEANGFQKRAIFARALLAMNREKELLDVINSQSSGWVNQFQVRLLSDLVDANQLELLKAAFEQWGAADESDARDTVQKRLLENEMFERATSLDWLGAEADPDSAAIAWNRWFASDETAASAAFEKAKTKTPDDLALRLVECQRDPERANDHYQALTGHWRTRPLYVATMLESSHAEMGMTAWAELNTEDKQKVLLALFDRGHAELLRTHGFGELESAEQVMRLALLGDWDAVYELIGSTKKTLRNGLYDAVVQGAFSRGDYAVMLDALEKLPCSDMNSAGLRAIQKAFREMAAPHFRFFHP